MELEKRKGLVRGVVTVWGGIELLTAYTIWFPHDTPDLEAKLKKSIDLLADSYFKMSDMTRGRHTISIEHEWRDYKH